MVDEIQENLKKLDKDTVFEIVEDDFKMVFDGGYRFDLYFLHHKKVKKGEDPKPPEWKLEGYNMTLIYCLKRILYNRINKKHDVLTMKEFYKELKQMNDELVSLLHEVTGHGC